VSVPNTKFHWNILVSNMTHAGWRTRPVRFTKVIGIMRNKMWLLLTGFQNFPSPVRTPLSRNCKTEQRTHHIWLFSSCWQQPTTRTWHNTNQALSTARTRLTSSEQRVAHSEGAAVHTSPFDSPLGTEENCVTNKYVVS